MDEMRMSIRSVWENNYIGKVTNNNRGRAIFKADVVAYITELQRLETVEASYDPVENITFFWLKKVIGVNIFFDYDIEVLA